MRAVASDIRFKICGLTRAEDIRAVADAGAHYAGFVFFEKSPRHLTLSQAKLLASETPVGLCKVVRDLRADASVLDKLD